MSWPEPPLEETVVLRLFVTGTTTRSQRAIANIHRLCERHLAGRFDLSIVDVYLDPEATREFQIVATPTLVRLQPGPKRRIVGDLSDEARVMSGLNLVPPEEMQEARS